MTRKRDIHVSVCGSEGFRELRNRRKRGEIECGGRGAGAQHDGAMPAGIIYARMAQEAKEMYLCRSTNQMAALGFFTLAGSQQ